MPNQDASCIREFAASNAYERELGDTAVTGSSSLGLLPVLARSYFPAWTVSISVKYSSPWAVTALT